MPTSMDLFYTATLILGSKGVGGFNMFVPEVIGCSALNGTSCGMDEGEDSV